MLKSDVSRYTSTIEELSTQVSEMQAIEFATEGNVCDFGDTTQERYGHAYGNVGNTTRGVFMGGGTPTRLDEIDFITFASTGDAADFGDCAEGHRSQGAGVSNQTRAFYCGGSSPQGVKNHIDLVIIASLGEVSDFGDINGPADEGGRYTMPNTAMSPTRGLFAGGKHNSPSDYVNTIELITMATLGDATDFGDLIVKGGRSSGNCSSNTRGVFSISNYPSSDNITIEFVTIATTGNATDFGDLAQTGLGGDVNALSSPTRCVISGGGAPSGGKIGFVEISTLGNSTFFGDLTLAGTSLQSAGTVSNAHGGL